MHKNFAKPFLAFLVAGALGTCPLTASAYPGSLSAGSANTAEDAGLLSAAESQTGALQREAENNDLRDNACTLGINSTLIGTMSSAADLDWYKVVVPYNGRFECTLEPYSDSSLINGWDVVLFTEGNATIHESMYGVSSGNRIYAVDSLPAGTYYVRVTIEPSSYVGSNAVYLLSTALTGVDFKQATVTVEDTTFNGVAQTPAVTVKYGENPLQEGTDYEVEYSNNESPGTGIATVRGKGMFDGAVVKTFDIAEIPSGDGGTGGTGSGTLDSGNGNSDAGSNSGNAGTDTSPGTGGTGGAGSGTTEGIDTGSGAGDAGNGSTSGTGGGAGSPGNTDGTGSSSTDQGDAPGSDSGATSGSSTGNSGNAGSSSGTGAGSSSGANADNQVSRVMIYRLYNPFSGEHMYTPDASERMTLIGLGWANEGIGWIAPSDGEAVHRLYNPYSGDHHFTTSSSERDILVGLGWRYEGIGWHTADSKGVPIYRQYNPYAKSFYHNYTASKAENDHLVSVGWLAEGVGWYGLS